MRIDDDHNAEMVPRPVDWKGSIWEHQSVHKQGPLARGGREGGGETEGSRGAPVAVGRDGEDVAVMHLAGYGMSCYDVAPHHQGPGHFRRGFPPIPHLSDTLAPLIPLQLWVAVQGFELEYLLYLCLRDLKDCLNVHMLVLIEIGNGILLLLNGSGCIGESKLS